MIWNRDGLILLVFADILFTWYLYLCNSLIKNFFFFLLINYPRQRRPLENTIMLHDRFNSNYWRYEILAGLQFLGTIS